ncbi:unnamed protein product [Spodoptera exigua]|nr:unnamed protein product [Spodoptera exigua]
MPNGRRHSCLWVVPEENLSNRHCVSMFCTSCLQVHLFRSPFDDPRCHLCMH